MTQPIGVDWSKRIGDDAAPLYLWPSCPTCGVPRATEQPVEPDRCGYCREAERKP